MYYKSNFGNETHYDVSAFLIANDLYFSVFYNDHINELNDWLDENKLPREHETYRPTLPKDGFVFCDPVMRYEFLLACLDYFKKDFEIENNRFLEAKNAPEGPKTLLKLKKQVEEIDILRKRFNAEHSRAIKRASKLIEYYKNNNAERRSIYSHRLARVKKGLHPVPFIFYHTQRALGKIKARLDRSKPPALMMK